MKWIGEAGFAGGFRDRRSIDQELLDPADSQFHESLGDALFGLGHVMLV